MNTNIIKWC